MRTSSAWCRAVRSRPPTTSRTGSYPILIGFHIMAHTRDYPEVSRRHRQHVYLGHARDGRLRPGPVFHHAAWDALWMLGSQMSSQGDPVPLCGVRVFSTMNSSGPFAFAMMGAMVFVHGGHAAHALDRGRRSASSRSRSSLVRLDVGRLGDRAGGAACQVEQQGALADHRERGAALVGLMRAAARLASVRCAGLGGGRVCRPSTNLSERPELCRAQRVLRDLRGRPRSSDVGGRRRWARPARRPNSRTRTADLG